MGLRLLDVISTLLVLVAAAPAGGASGGGTAARYLVFATQPDGSVRAVFSRRVQLRSPLRGRPYTGARAATRDLDEVGVRLEDAHGAVVFEDAVRIPRWLRGEFHGQGPGALGEFTIDGHLLPEQAAAFVVRVPDVGRATLALDFARAGKGARFDLDALDADAAVARSVPPQPPPLAGWSNGDPANRLDVLIMGDGYTAAQEAQFTTDAQSVANSFFSITPYAEYRNYVNVSALFTPSAQSGVDQPPYDGSCSQYDRVQTCCADPDASSTTPVAVSTAFNGTFCSFNVQRLVTVDNALVFAAAAAEPDWDEILVLANSPTYGGSGGSIGVISMNAAAVEVAQHEFGHTFMKLADEYSTPFPGYPACSDVLGGFPPCEPNVTDETSRPAIKWTRWIAATQPVPSVAPPPVATDAGLWQGARYLTTGMYRQGYACIMQFLGAPFCDVAAETYPLTMYQGGWGVPGSGVDNIEPGSESPAPGSLMAPFPGGSYSAMVLGPQAGPNVTGEWYVDSVLVDTQAIATGGTASYALVTTPGPHTLELRVTDNSPIIHPTMRAGLASSRTWNVTVGSNLCGNSVLDPGEICDDGDATDGDGCSATCQVETCWLCAGLPSVCTPDNGASCSTGDSCVVGETCSGGTCGGGTPVTACTGGDGCCPVGCTSANDLDCGSPTLTSISGEELLVKDNANQTKRKIVFLSKDAQIDSSSASGIDPASDGASLQIYNANGSGESICVALPSGGWLASGQASLPVYEYKDTAFANGPCKAATVKHAKLLKVTCQAKLQPIAYSLDEPAQGTVAVRFTSGSTTYCASFGGVVSKDSGTDPPIAGGKGVFSAKDSAPPFPCPAAPASCP